MSSEAWVKIILALIGLIGTVITYVAVPYLKQKTTTAQRENIEFWVYMGVAAAEQIFQIPKSGEEKKQFVVEYLVRLGIKLSEQELNILIEAAVYELNKFKADVME